MEQADDTLKANNFHRVIKSMQWDVRAVDVGGSKHISSRRVDAIDRQDEDDFFPPLCDVLA